MNAIYYSAFAGSSSVCNVVQSLEELAHRSTFLRPSPEARPGKGGTPIKLGLPVMKRARKQMYSVAAVNEEDDLAGVSTLMKALPDKKPSKRRTPKPPAKRTRKPAAKKRSRT